MFPALAPGCLLGAACRALVVGRLDVPGVERFIVSQVRLSAPERAPFQVDGDPAGLLPARIVSSLVSVPVLVPAR